MKKIEAIINSFKLSDVQDALQHRGFRAMIVTEAKEFNSMEGHLEVYGGVECEIEYRNIVKIEIILPDKDARSAIEAICNAARTDRNGDDGRILVSAIDWQGGKYHR